MRERSHAVLVRHVEDELRSGRITVGGRLPAERSLAEQLGVSRASVREGIRVLEAMGLIRTTAGSGPDAGAIIVADTSAGISSSLRLHLASRSLPVGDIVTTRLLLESWAVANADPAALGEASGLLAGMNDRRLSAEEFHLMDADFHVSLARAAGNDVVSAIMVSLREVIHRYVMDTVTDLPDWPAMARRLRTQHRNILAAIEAGNGERASHLVSAHITGFYRATQIGSQ
jgi:GntR family transcriptional repressor for pyruvate dehydrogenase complex